MILLFLRALIHLDVIDILTVSPTLPLLNFTNSMSDVHAAQTRYVMEVVVHIVITTADFMLLWIGCGVLLAVVMRITGWKWLRGGQNVKKKTVVDAESGRDSLEHWASVQQSNSGRTESQH